MLDAAGWALPSLVAEYGSQTAYRVTREGGRVRLEGRRGSEACLLWSESPASALNQLDCRAPSTAWPPLPTLAPRLALPPAAQATKETWQPLA